VLNRGIIERVFKKRRKKSGFSLLELMVVMVIISLITAMIVPRMGGTLNKLNLKTAAKKVAASLRYARSRAASEKEVYVAFFNFELNQLEIKIERKFSYSFEDSDNFEKDDTGTLSSDNEEFYKIEQKKIKPKIYILSEGVFFEKAKSLKGEEETGLFKIFFYPGGNCSGGEVTLIGENEKRISINVDFITGTVKLVD